MPLLIFLTIFVITPLVELYFLIEVGSVIGALPTILLSLFTAALGGWLVRLQGISVLFRVREAAERGQPPALEMLEGAVLLACGLLLLLPGLITDILGFLMLIPPLRRALLLGVLSKVKVMQAGMHVHGGPGGNTTVDGEYRRVEPGVIEADRSQEKSPER